MGEEGGGTWGDDGLMGGGGAGRSGAGLRGGGLSGGGGAVRSGAGLVGAGRSGAGLALSPLRMLASGGDGGGVSGITMDVGDSLGLDGGEGSGLAGASGSGGLGGEMATPTWLCCGATPLPHHFPLHRPWSSSGCG